jgi:hypothetical protein
MSHLPPAHHEASKRDSLTETKIKEKQNKTSSDSNSNLAKSMTHHNQTKDHLVSQKGIAFHQKIICHLNFQATSLAN